MREILFRGKRIDNGEWAYGDLINNYDGRKFVGEVVVDDYKGTANDTYEVGIGFVEVDPSTVGMCVPGITDKNGKKIFEGDILENLFYDAENFREEKGQLVADEVEYRSFGIVSYNDDMGAFYVETKTYKNGVPDSDVSHEYLGSDDEHCEYGFLEQPDEELNFRGTIVIGNVHEPELLKKIRPFCL